MSWKLTLEFAVRSKCIIYHISPTNHQFTRAKEKLSDPVIQRIIIIISASAPAGTGKMCYSKFQTELLNKITFLGLWNDAGEVHTLIPKLATRNEVHIQTRWRSASPCVQVLGTFMEKKSIDQ